MATSMRVNFKPMQRDMRHMFLLGRVKRVYHENSRAVIYSLERMSGLRFLRGVTVLVGFSEESCYWEGAAGYDGRQAVRLYFPSRERVDFDDMAIWLLMHEFGHRLLEQYSLQHDYKKIGSDNNWSDAEHRLLFLFLINAIHAMGVRGEYILQTFPTIGYTDLSQGVTRAWIWANALSPARRRQLWRSVMKTHDLMLLQDTN